MLPASRYLRTAIMWAMIPLTVFASRPVTGCTCASGEYKFSCVAHLPHRQAPHDSSRAAVKCEKACCQQQGDAAHGAAGCPLADGRPDPGGKKCCNPDTATAVTSASPVTFSVDNDHQVLFDLPTVESGSVFPDLTLARFIPHETGPPGGDLVVALRRLLV